MFRYLVFGLISFGLGSIAFADDLSDAIQAYNAAQQSGDRATRLSTGHSLAIHFRVCELIEATARCDISADARTQNFSTCE
jgi:hypothetical protein